MFLVYRMNGIYRMHPVTGSSSFNLAMCIVAFGVVALVTLLVHPTSRSGPTVTAAQNVAVANEVAAASASLKPVDASILRQQVQP